MLLNIITELSVSTEYYKTISECQWIFQPRWWIELRLVWRDMVLKICHIDGHSKDYNPISVCHHVIVDSQTGRIGCPYTCNETQWCVIQITRTVVDWVIRSTLANQYWYLMIYDQSLRGVPSEKNHILFFFLICVNIFYYYHARDCINIKILWLCYNYIY